MITVFFRTLIIYLITIIAMRLTGKRQIGELQVTELVVTFILSELAVYPITDNNVPLLHVVIPIISLLSLEVIFTFIQTKSPRFRKLFNGKPTVIISHGKLCPGELANNRVDISELLGELRLKGVFNVNDVEYAVLEENGKLSVLTKASESALTPSQLGFTVKEHGLSHPIVVDGILVPHSLELVNKSHIWFENFLSDHSFTIKNIFLMTLDDCGEADVFVRADGSKNDLVRREHIPSKKRRDSN